MAKIKLTKGKFAIVDDADFEFLNQFKWYLTSHNYAKQSSSPRQYMHTIINKTPKGKITDHINRNTLDNRKENLRTGDKRLNSINRGLQTNNTSGYRGISWMPKLKKWEVYIWNFQKKIGLGYFNNIKKAVSVRKEAEKKLWHTI